ncbi:MAG: HD domain-containing protein, partial [Clostridiales bacterium]|nr:HD domain-containing protein [Clostridiales bacterium]
MLQDEKDRILSVNATKCSDSRGRVRPEKDGDIRNCFERDMGRIIYSQAFRRLKHKTQVFFNPANDHICSRLEHVIYVDYIASTIGRALNLNVDLIRAIALGHDVGHTPF